MTAIDTPAETMHIDVHGQLCSFDLLFSPRQISQREHELAVRLAEIYAGHTESVHALTVLRGAAPTANSIIAHLRTLNSNLRVVPHDIRLTSYAGTESSGMVTRLNGPEPADYAGKHWIVFEDIIESGITMDWLIGHIADARPGSLTVVTLLQKPGPYMGVHVLDQVGSGNLDVPILTGFEIGAAFVIGHGMDYNERYRDLQGIYAMRGTA